MARAYGLGLLLGTLVSVVPLGAQTPPAAPERPLPSLAAGVNEITAAEAPSIRDRWVVFSYRPETTARYVAIRFEHEGYAVLHPMLLNQHRIFVLLYQPPADLETLTYRMSVDGLWMRDPSNPVYTTDAFGTPYSHVDLSALPAPPPTGPVVHGDGRVTFALRSAPGELVTLTGSFNHWDPFVHVMEEIATGTYELTLRLPAGVYYYYFLENGRKRLDPNNQETRRDTEGQMVNRLSNP